MGSVGEVDTAQGQIVVPVEQVFDADVETDALPLIAGAKIEQGVAGGERLPAQGIGLGLAIDQLDLDGTGPTAEGVLQGEFAVERHHVVEGVARGGLAVHPAKRALDVAPTIGGAVPDIRLAGDVDTINLRIMIDELKRCETIDRGDFLNVDVVLDIGVVRGNLDVPAFAALVVQTGRQAERVRDFRLEVDISGIIVEIAEPANHI